MTLIVSLIGLRAPKAQMWVLGRAGRAGRAGRGGVRFAADILSMCNC